jgi:hypothetical protein
MEQVNHDKPLSMQYHKGNSMGINATYSPHNKTL